MSRSSRAARCCIVMRLFRRAGGRRPCPHRRDSARVACRLGLHRQDPAGVQGDGGPRSVGAVWPRHRCSLGPLRASPAGRCATAETEQHAWVAHLAEISVACAATSSRARVCNSKPAQSDDCVDRCRSLPDSGNPVQSADTNRGLASVTPTSVPRAPASACTLPPSAEQLVFDKRSRPCNSHRTQRGFSLGLPQLLTWVSGPWLPVDGLGMVTACAKSCRAHDGLPGSPGSCIARADMSTTLVLPPWPRPYLRG